jgi:hypothetical protein
VTSMADSARLLPRTSCPRLHSTPTCSDWTWPLNSRKVTGTNRGHPGADADLGVTRIPSKGHLSSPQPKCPQRLAGTATCTFQWPPMGDCCVPYPGGVPGPKRPPSSVTSVPTVTSVPAAARRPRCTDAKQPKVQTPPRSPAATPVASRQLAALSPRAGSCAWSPRGTRDAGWLPRAPATRPLVLTQPATAAASSVLFLGSWFFSLCFAFSSPRQVSEELQERSTPSRMSARCVFLASCDSSMAWGTRGEATRFTGAAGWSTVGPVLCDLGWVSLPL